MGENLAVEGRGAVRTPMQWTSGPNAGFSTADPSQLRAPVTEGEFGPQHVNVADQRRDPDSLLNWIKLLVRRYRECPELSWGECTILEHNTPAVFAHRSEYEDGAIVTAHNFGAEATEVTLAVAGSGVGLRAVDLLRDGTTELAENGSLSLQLEPYASRWLRIITPQDRYII
jgi:maltose alpha-D-glucosyltransferase/alpha-amylase